jgi:outer membrane protein
MKLFTFTIIFIFNLNSVFASEFLTYLENAYKNNPTLNAERENYKAIKENINISRSEFLPSVTVSGSQNSQQSSNKTDQVGAAKADSNINTETQAVSIDQKIFQGFQGYNSIKKSKIESEQGAIKLMNVEQQVLLQSATAYYDLIYKIRNKQFNLANVDLFERQVETDASRLQKGEITLTDLAQSESSLAGANAKLIAAETDLLVAKSNFERVIRLSAPDKITKDNFIETIRINFPSGLNSVLAISEKYNPKLLLAKLDYEISKKNVNIEKI